MSKEKQVVISDQAPAAIGPYSQAIQAGHFVFISGQIPLDQEGNLAQGDIAVQAGRVLENLTAILQAAGLTLMDVVKTTVFLTDLNDFAEMNRIYAQYFPESPPARSTIQVAALPRGAAIEIEAVAYKK
jgi:2-iminobutanoate/2-iminopropanoate deaminase